MSEKVSNNISIYNSESNYASYYRIFFSSNFDGNIIGRPELPKILPVTALDTRWIIEKKYHYRLDMIAQKWYGREYIDFIWVLMLYNQPSENPAIQVKETGVFKKVILPEDEQVDAKTGVDPFKDFPAGREIYIPSRTTVEGRII